MSHLATGGAPSTPPCSIDLYPGAVLCVPQREKEGLVIEFHATQEELFKLSGISRSTIAVLESGTRMAREDTARNLARALNVKPEDLA